MDLSIIISTKDRPDIFNRTLEQAVKATLHIEAEIIIVNDSREMIPEIGQYIGNNVRMIGNSGSGVASARNLGAREAHADLLLFLDDDILIDKNSIDQTLAFHRTEKNVCLNPDWVYPEALRKRLTESPFGRFLIQYDFISCKGWYNNPRWKDNAVFDSPSLASFHLTIARADFIRSGGYNEKFPFAGFEDHAISQAFLKAGMRLMINSKILVFHNEEDRIELKQWLMRQVRGSHTRRVGVDIGYAELAIPYSNMKRTILQCLLVVKPLFIGLASLVPNSRKFDFVYFRMALLLQAVSIFEGYSNKRG